MDSYWIFIFVLLPMGIILDDSNKGDMKINEFVSKQGYPFETYEVETEDGYILTVFRIPYGRNGPNNFSRIPVLLNHGLFLSAEVYVFLGPVKSLAFVLADNGYDVWLMNDRGVYHSRKHKRFTIDQKIFWKFSWHEIGIYDIPAVIDYILLMTSKTTLHYIGYSQGCTSIFVMGSERPEYNSKIKVMIALAPGARYKYTKEPLLRILAPHYKLIEKLMDNLGVYELPPPFVTDESIKKLLKLMCYKNDITNLICKSTDKRISRLLDVADQQNILNGVLSTFSTRQVLHYAQLIASGNFQQYDFGKKQNLKLYGTEDPPLYNLSNITFSVGLFWGASDRLVTKEDIPFLRQSLPNIVEDYRVPLDSFNHLDFIIGHNLSNILHNPILMVLSRFK